MYLIPEIRVPVLLNRPSLCFVAVLSIWSKSGFKFEWDGINYQNMRGEYTKSSPRALSSGNGNYACNYSQSKFLCRVSHSAFNDAKCLYKKGLE